MGIVAEDFSKKPKRYILIEFPYPSGDGLHVGHVRSYAALDAVARMWRLRGANVLYPIGWDAFGLPTENYAIKTGRHPSDITKENVATFKRQMQSLGLSLDWSREVNTSDPAYYRWTQWIFLQFFKKGLAYQATIPINWCPKDKIGLANEEVVNGKCERCGTEVTRRMQKQWLLKITAYAERLLQDLATVDYLPQIKTQQANWIGKSEGAEVKFAVDNEPWTMNKEDPRSPSGVEEIITVFTTRPDTLFGATYLVLAPEHPLISQLTTDAQRDAVQKYVSEAARKSDLERTELQKEKTGVFTGSYAINPVNDERVPIWVADYVLASYGTGAIMAVPAHDDRDFAFARKYRLPIRQVIAPHVIDLQHPPRKDKENTARVVVHAMVQHPKEKTFLALHWKQFGWRTFITGGPEGDEDLIDAAKREVHEETGYKHLTFVGKLPYVINAEFYAAHKDVNRSVQANFLLFTLDDLEKDKVAHEEQDRHEGVWTPMKDLGTLSPVTELAYVLDWFAHGDHAFTGEGVLMNSGTFSGLPSEEVRDTITALLQKNGAGKAAVTYKLRDWVFSRQHYWGEPIPIIHCPEHGAVPVPEDQLPVELPHVEKYHPTDTGESPLASIPGWVNTSCPTCAKPAKRETDTMPNWAGSSWYYLRYCDPHNDKAFAQLEKLRYWLPVDLYNGGMEHTTLHLLYSRFWHKFLFDLGLVPRAEPYQRRHSHGIVLAEDGRKMSKSFGNVINPDPLIEKYGADSVRMYEMFMGPFEDMIPWSTQGLIGVHRFLKRVNRFFPGMPAAQDGKPTEVEGKELERIRHQTIKKVTEDLERLKFNTAVSALMEYVNELERARTVDDSTVFERARETLLVLLFPFAPFLSADLWKTWKSTDIEAQPWPTYDPSKLKAETFELVIQVNGKVRARISAPSGSSAAEAEALALSRENVQKYLAGAKPKAVFVPDRLINFVTRTGS